MKCQFGTSILFPHLFPHKNVNSPNYSLIKVYFCEDILHDNNAKRETASVWDHTEADA